VFDFSNVVLGENVVNVNPDCTPMGCLPSVQDIEVESVTVHENWDKNKVDAGNDIALIRLAKPARFYTVRDLSSPSFPIIDQEKVGKIEIGKLTKYVCLTSKIKVKLKEME
jgi:hypothetical protein